MNCSLWENVRHISPNSSSLTLNRVCDAQGNTSSTQYHIYTFSTVTYTCSCYSLCPVQRGEIEIRRDQERTKCHPRLCQLLPAQPLHILYTSIYSSYPVLPFAERRDMERRNTWNEEKVTSKVDSTCPSAQSFQWYRIQWYFLCVASSSLLFEYVQ